MASPEPTEEKVCLFGSLAWISVLPAVAGTLASLLDDLERWRTMRVLVLTEVQYIGNAITGPIHHAHNLGAASFVMKCSLIHGSSSQPREGRLFVTWAADECHGNNWLQFL